MAKSVSIEDKGESLRGILKEASPVVVALSGGVDSSLLLSVAVETLGPAASAAIAVSPSLSRDDLDDARALCRRLDAPWLEVETSELEDPNYTLNVGDRCFFCKMEQYGAILAATEHLEGRVLVDGTLADDCTEDRPGLQANSRLGIRSPLREAGFTKDDVRAWARERRLEVWNKPEAACLASRVPVGDRVTAQVLEQVESAERALRHLGLRVIRVRHHDRMARIETHPDEMPRLLKRREEVVAALRAVGYDTVAMDLAGYRRRKANEHGESSGDEVAQERLRDPGRR